MLVAMVDGLVAEYKSTRDEEVFKQLYELVKPRMQRVANGVYGNEQDKEDCLQYCAIALLRTIEAYDPVEAAMKGGSFLNYLSRAMHNERTYFYGTVHYGIPTQDNNRVNYTTRDYVNRQDLAYLSQKLSLDAMVSDEENESDGISFLDMVEDRRESSQEDRVFVDSFIHALLDLTQQGIERTVITLIVKHYLKISEVAKQLQVSDSKVRTVVGAYRDRVLPKLQQMGYIEDLTSIFGKSKVIDFGILHGY